MAKSCLLFLVSYRVAKLLEVCQSTNKVMIAIVSISKPVYKKLDIELLHFYKKPV